MGTKIRDLTDTATSVNDNDFLVIASSDNKTKKINGANFKNSISAGLGVPVIATELLGLNHSKFADQGDAGITVEILLSYRSMSGASGRGQSNYGVQLRFTNPNQQHANGTNKTLTVTIAGSS